MFKYALIAALVACLGLGGWAYVLSAKNATLTAKNESLTRSVAALTGQAEQSALARDVEEARAKRWAQRTIELNATIEAILVGEVPDETLDPRIADFINGLRSED